MGFFDIFKKQAKKADFDAEKRTETATKAQITRLENDLRRFSLARKHKYLLELKDKLEEKALEEDIASLEEQLAEGDDDSADFSDGINPDQLITQMIMSKFNQPAAMAAPQFAPPQAAHQGKLTDEQLKAEIQKIPDDVLYTLTQYSDNELKGLIKQKYPTLDDETQEKAVALIRAEGA